MKFCKKYYHNNFRFQMDINRLRLKIKTKKKLLYKIKNSFIFFSFLLSKIICAYKYNIANSMIFMSSFIIFHALNPLFLRFIDGII